MSNLPPPAIIILGQNSLATARNIAEVLPEARIYGSIDRTTNVDVTYSDFGETVRELFVNGNPIIGICAAGILIRTLAPLIRDKWHEPPVIAVAEDGSAVVPLLGGLQGANDLARTIAGIFDTAAAVTATGDIRFRTTLLNPPQGYRLANPEDAKTFIADLLQGATLKIRGSAPWLQDSRLPFADDGNLALSVTEYLEPTSTKHLVYHPATLVVSLINLPDLDDSGCRKSIDRLLQALTQANLSPKSIAAMVVLPAEANHPVVKELMALWQVPLRFWTDERSGAASVARQATGKSGEILILDEIDDCFAVSCASQPLEIDNIGQKRGKLTIVGTGPGSIEWMSPEVKQALQTATDWVGYKTYLDLVEPLRQGQTRNESDNRVEIERAIAALNLASEGRSVAVVSSGDPGIFAMAAAVFEALERENRKEWQTVEIKICPGISAMQGAAALVGAPLGHDFCAISLSDILKPWSIVAKRLEAVATADLVIALYNPVSKERTWQLDEARDIIMRHRSSHTPVVLARNVGRAKQHLEVITLGELTSSKADMRTVILIGSSKTRLISRPYDRPWVYTPRSY